MADGVSIRSMLDRLDPADPPDRIRGNGPPYDRPPEDNWNERARYNGEQYVTHAVGTAGETAYDMGMINRIPGDTPSNMTPKGLIETHRLLDPDEGSVTDPDGNPEPSGAHSLRRITDRHEQSTTHKIGWINTKLGTPAGLSELRASMFGTLLGGAGYDILACGEVERPMSGDPSNITDSYRSAYPGSVDRAHHSKGALHTIVGSGRGATRSVEGVTDDVYDRHKPFEGTRKKGYQRFDIALEVPGVSNAGIELFVTHLFPGTEKIDREIRRDQYEELRDIVNERRNARPAWPKVVVGDMNVHSNKSRLRPFLQTMAEANLDDAWLTHGGPTGDTHRFDYCTTTAYPDAGTDSVPLEACMQFNDGDIGGSRIDYVFLERPAAEHTIACDVSRTWRLPMNRGNEPVKERADYREGQMTGWFSWVTRDILKRDDGWIGLTDHLGLGLELHTAPNWHD